jgi:sugar phosphate isomerase/epimerase
MTRGTGAIIRVIADSDSMRLGLNWVPIETRSDLEAALPLVDELGLGTISAPDAMSEWSVERCEVFGQMVRDQGLTVGEYGYWENLLTRDEDKRTERIRAVQGCLERADAMGVDCVVTLAGTFGGSWAGAPHPDNWSDEARERVVENCRRVLDGVDLNHTTYALEPWFNSFFHRPRVIRSLIDDVDRPSFGVHMDAMNMHSIQDVYRSRRLVDEAFDLLAGDVASVHVKDIRWNTEPGILSLEEVLPGDGSMDYDRYVQHLDELPDDVAVFTEHWETDEEFVETMHRMREIAERNGVEPVQRTDADEM